MEQDCTIYKAANFIGKRWTLLILLELYKRNKWKRYSEIKKNMPKITPKILSARLKELQVEDLIEKRIDSSQVPIKSEYALTESGLDFIKIIKDIKKWTLKWKTRNILCEKSNCKECEL